MVQNVWSLGRVLLCVLAIVIAGCGGDNQSEGDTPDDSGPPTDTTPPDDTDPGDGTDPDDDTDPDDAPPSALWHTLDQRAAFTALSADAEIRNPMQGYHRWRGQESVPQSLPALDAYQRYEWREFESAQGDFDFSPLIADVQMAIAQGRKASFRVRMMVGYDDGEIYLPEYLVGHEDCANGCGWWADYDTDDPDLTFVPDWNDEFLQQRAAMMLNALAAALATYGDDIAWIDIGLYGQYGEWTLSSAIDYGTAPAGIDPITNASKREFARMHFEAFSGHQLVMFALYGNYDTLQYALAEQATTTLPVGLRIDCLGRASFMNQWIHRPSEYALISDRWRMAPFVAEFCPFESVRNEGVHSPADALTQIETFHISMIGNGNLGQAWEDFSSAEQSDLLAIAAVGFRYSLDFADISLDEAGVLSISAQVRNSGNAPTYEPWTVKLELYNASDVLVWEAALSRDLRDLKGGGDDQVFSLSAMLPASLPEGTYALRWVARDARDPGRRDTLRWAVEESREDGSVALATLQRLAPSH